MERLIILFITSAMLAAVYGSGSGDAEWTYFYGTGLDPDHWADDYGICGDSSQSPINIVTSEAEFDPSVVDADDDPFVLSGDYLTLPANYTGNFTLRNSGHGVSVSLPTDTFLLNGGGLTEDYYLLGFHLHWGNNDMGDTVVGSEHKVDDVAYPAEMHFVHATEPVTPTMLANNEGDIAVLGMFIEIGEANAAFDNILNELALIQFQNSSFLNIDPFDITNLLPSEDDRKSFYRYQGGLTTPPCSEVVTWTVFSEPLTMSQAQMDTLRSSLYATSSTEYPLIDNYRPAFTLTSDRTVYASMEELDISACPHVVPSMFTLLMISLCMLLI